MKLQKIIKLSILLLFVFMPIVAFCVDINDILHFMRIVHIPFNNTSVKIALTISFSSWYEKLSLIICGICLFMALTPSSSTKSDDKVSQDHSSQKKNTETTSKPFFGSSGKLIGYVILFMVITLVIFIYYHHTRGSSMPSESKLSLSQPNNSQANYLEEIKIDPEIANSFDKNDMIKELGLTTTMRTNLKKILSDKNPDPEHKDGEVCGQNPQKCKWCGKIFSVNNNYTTIQNEIKGLVSPVGSIGVAYSQVIDKFTGKNNERQKIIEQLNQYANAYARGEKYTCIINTADFCSEKCKTEYNFKK